MNPLIVIAARILPGIIASIANDPSGGVKKAVLKAVAEEVGASDPADVEEKLRKDSTLRQKIEQSPELQEKLATIALDQEKARLSAETDRIRLQNEAVKAQNDTALALSKQADETTLALRKQIDEASLVLGKQADEANARLAELGAARTDAAQALQKELVAAKTPIAWVPAILSFAVVAGFFLVLFTFLLLKQQIESQALPAIPIGQAWTQLSDDQRAALLRPPSDFAVQILNILIGTMAAGFTTVLSFWLGSSTGSREKDRQIAGAAVIAQNAAGAVASAEKMRDEAEVARSAAESARNEITAALPPSVAQELIQTNRLSAPAMQGLVGANRSAFSGGLGSGAQLSFGSGGFSEGGLVSPPPPPIAPGTLAAEVVDLVKPHKYIQTGVSWALTVEGISVEGAPASRTGGEPKTVTRIWDNFGPQCADAARIHGVPVELIIATIATESGGNPDARRKEPQIKDESVGLMQTLVGTARQELERPGLTADDLRDPATSIAAGTVYIANRRRKTHFDPPLVAASYNAGDLYKEDLSGNRWRLRCYPSGTGRHIDNFAAWFGDAMRVSAATDWSEGGRVPSFAFLLRDGGSELGGGGSQGGGGLDARTALASVGVAGQFPPRPDFRAITSVEREQLFGSFRYRADPQPGNREQIEILDDWVEKNIVEVKLPPFPGYRHAEVSTLFHRRGAEQLRSLWLEWKDAGLLNRILTFDGAFVPRFQRGSTKELSNHAWGTAFDINWEQNQLNEEPSKPGIPGCVYDLVPAANRHGFFWGGHFMSRKDGMHFEIAQLRP